MTDAEYAKVEQMLVTEGFLKRLKNGKRKLTLKGFVQQWAMYKRINEEIERLNNGEIRNVSTV